jgi:hypothetical protein
MNQSHIFLELVGFLLYKNIFLLPLLALMIMFITILLILLSLVFTEWVIPLRRGYLKCVYEHSHRVFIGPKIRKDLAVRADNLELSIDMGWFWFISQPMVWFLDLINGYINNWAVSIVVVYFDFKACFIPCYCKRFCCYGQHAKGWADDERNSKQVW